jgi:RNA polymerase sigma-70 factor (ECF subfamily)
VEVGIHEANVFGQILTSGPCELLREIIYHHGNETRCFGVLPDELSMVPTIDRHTAGVAENRSEENEFAHDTASGADISDAELFARFLTGDDPAFMRFVQRHTKRLLVYCQRILNDDAAAGDIVQDVWERMIRFRVEHKPAPRSPVGLVIRTARNLCLNHLRDNRRYVALDDQSQLETSEPKRTELEDAVAYGLEQLPMEQREVLVLNAYAGYRFEEIAEMFDEPAGTIRSRAMRGRARLGEIIRLHIKKMNDANDASRRNSTH